MLCINIENLCNKIWLKFTYCCTDLFKSTFKLNRNTFLTKYQKPVRSYGLHNMSLNSL